MVLEDVKDSSLDEWRKGLLTRFGERIGLADRAAGRRLGEWTPGSELVRSMGAAVRSGLLQLECNRGGVAKPRGELGKAGNGSAQHAGEIPSVKIVMSTPVVSV